MHLLPVLCVHSQWDSVVSPLATSVLASEPSPGGSSPSLAGQPLGDSPKASATLCLPSSLPGTPGTG